MSSNEVQAAIITLLTVGVLLLNVGADMVQDGAVETGLMVCAFGALFIVAAIILIKVLAEKTARFVAYGTGGRKVG